jgi:hypothetical protein
MESSPVTTGKLGENPFFLTMLTRLRVNWGHEYITTLPKPEPDRATVHFAVAPFVDFIMAGADTRKGREFQMY